MHKRGISPLITTVLLLGLVISLITVFVIWNQKAIKERFGEAEEATVKLSCQTDIDFDVLNACYFDSETIQIRVENNKDKPVNAGFILIINNRIINPSFPLTNELKAHSTLIFYASIPETIESIRVVPKIRSGNQAVICPNQGLTLRVQEISSC